MLLSSSLHGVTLQPVQIRYVKKFTQKQHELGIYGAVGEVGVHHGKFLIPIVGNALVDEPAVALDLFEDQRANVDTSGEGCVLVVKVHAFVVCAGTCCNAQ